MAASFVPALVVGAALVALWVDVRRPSLAPDSLAHRVLAAALAALAVRLVPVLNGSLLAAYVSVFALLLPALVSSFLTAVWLMRSVRDGQLGLGSG
jgi:ABC-type Mn2+/Zn2+ transport system permease subunit